MRKKHDRASIYLTTGIRNMVVLDGFRENRTSTYGRTVVIRIAMLKSSVGDGDGSMDVHPLTTCTGTDPWPWNPTMVKFKPQEV